MRKKFFFILLISSQLIAQNKSAIFGNSVVWYGIDFSQAKFVGDFNKTDLKNNLIPSWNLMPIHEATKYNVSRYFKKSTIYNDLDPVIKHNDSIDANNITTYNTYQFQNPTETVCKIVSSYSGGEKTEGLGLVFIVESYDKTQEQGSYYLTFFNIASKQVIYTEKLVESPGGFGVRNYWASTILKVMQRVENSRYYTWKVKFAKEKQGN